MLFSPDRITRQRGTAIVEFAILAPLLIVLTLGTIELGRYAYFAILVANAAQAGAAYGSQNVGTANDNTGIAAAVAQDASPHPIASVTANPAPFTEYGCWDGTNAQLATPFPAPTSSGTGAGSCSGTTTSVPYVSVSAQGTLVPLFHLPFLPSSITVNTTVVRRVQCTIGSGAACGS